MSALKLTLSVIACLVAFLGLIAVINNILNRPTLYTSNETKQCAFIENADGTKDPCSMYDPNQKYFHAWSK